MITLTDSVYTKLSHSEELDTERHITIKEERKASGDVKSIDVHIGDLIGILEHYGYEVK